MTTLRHQIMERLIMDQIILQMGQKMGVKISDEQLDQAIANIAKQNNMTLDQMRSRLAYDGLNYNTYRNQIRKEMIISGAEQRGASSHHHPAAGSRIPGAAGG